ncbi:hypothetical protein XENTR_v10007992 [Xenopus tropicalis]|nr:hypothetical protein XENTR_v10007992 [Xenopus tropicalis]
MLVCKLQCYVLPWKPNLNVEHVSHHNKKNPADLSQQNLNMRPANLIFIHYTLFYVVHTSSYVATTAGKFMFRPIGEDLKLFYQTDTAQSDVTWKWTSPNSQMKGKIAITKSILHTSPKFQNRVSVLKDALQLAPLDFSDAGTYTSDFGMIINLVTVQVKADPSTVVSYGSNLSLICTVSHVPDSNMALVWAKINRTITIQVKRQILNYNTLENIMIVDCVNEQPTNWACLVFHKSQLVAKLPVPLEYPKLPVPEVTTGTFTTSTFQLDTMINTELSTRDTLDLDNSTIITVCILIPLILVLLLLMCVMKTLPKPDLTEEPRASNAEEVQYITVVFKKPATGKNNTYG